MIQAYSARHNGVRARAVAGFARAWLQRVLSTLSSASWGRSVKAACPWYGPVDRRYHLHDGSTAD